MFLNLASDSSKLVRTGALQHLGRLISTLPGESVSEDLVRYFTGTAVESMGDPVVSSATVVLRPFWFSYQNASTSEDKVLDLIFKNNA